MLEKYGFIKVIFCRDQNIDMAALGQLSSAFCSMIKINETLDLGTQVNFGIEVDHKHTCTSTVLFVSYHLQTRQQLQNKFFTKV
jgi:hypothetical protein